MVQNIQESPRATLSGVILQNFNAKHNLNSNLIYSNFNLTLKSTKQDGNRVVVFIMWIN